MDDSLRVKFLQNIRNLKNQLIKLVLRQLLRFTNKTGQVVRVKFLQKKNLLILHPVLSQKSNIQVWVGLTEFCQKFCFLETEGG